MHGSPWTAQAEADALAALANFEEGLPVRLIATHRKELQTCRAGEDLRHVVRQNRAGYDHLPVEDDIGGLARIVGLLAVPRSTEHVEHGRRVESAMMPLSEEHLIGADAGILSFVRAAHRHECRLVIVGPQIGGLVTLSDLQKLPVRAALFGIITHLEMTMAEVIRREFTEVNAWKKVLPEYRQKTIARSIQRSQAKTPAADGYVDDVLFTTFHDKLSILRAASLGGMDVASFEYDMDEIRRLRNEIAHANNYASTRAAARRTCKAVGLIDAWIDRFSRWSGSGP